MTEVKLAEEPVKEETACTPAPETTEEMATFKVPKWLQQVEKVLLGCGMLVGMILATPFIAISFAIEYFRGKATNEHNDE